jgi:two-component system, OmpR family, phosphate regulon sensor histidine kinase PhoR
MAEFWREHQLWIWPLLALLAIAGLRWAWVERKLRQLAASNTLPVNTGPALLESLYTGLGDACLLVAQEGLIVYANEGAGQLFATSADLVGMRLSQIIPDSRISEFIQKAFALDQGSLEDEFTITVHPRGRTEERYFVLNAAPVFPLDGSEKQLRLVVRDETRRQETEQIRRDFVANASHELRTPLAIINGYLENLLEGEIEDISAVKKSLIIMQKHGERLAHLVEDMLVISKFEATEDPGAAAHLEQIFSCRECVEAVLERLHPMLEQKRARALMEFPPDDTLRGDRFYWDQVFFNLIENALKENAADGRLLITVVMERQPHQVILRVRDNGIGIPHEHLPFIFKRFYRVAKDHSQQRVKGTGLGLSIVKRAVEAHGGSIRVESSPGLRTEFVITLAIKLSTESVEIPAAEQT